MHKQPHSRRNTWDHSLEPGDRVYQLVVAGRTDLACMYDLRESRGRQKAASGELTPHLVKHPDKTPRWAKRVDGVWHWLTQEEQRDE